MFGIPQIQYAGIVKTSEIVKMLVFLRHFYPFFRVPL